MVERNGEGYLDPTASKGNRRITAEEMERKRFNKVVGKVTTLLRTYGYELSGYVTLVDIVTGRVRGYNASKILKKIRDRSFRNGKFCKESKKAHRQKD